MSKPSKYLIYALHHPSSVNVYVGKSSNGFRRPLDHARRCNRRVNAHLPVVRWIERRLAQNQVYEIAVLEECETSKVLDEAERFHIAYLRSIGLPLLNITDGGGGFLGGKHNENTRAIISRLHKGKKWSPERKARRASEIWPVSSETRAKLSKALKGRKMTPEQRRRSSEARKGKPLCPKATARAAEVNRNRVFSDEHKAKISSGLRGRVLSEVSRQKISASLKGKRLTPEQYKLSGEKRRGLKQSAETKAKKSASLKNRFFSEETKLKMSISQKRRALRDGVVAGKKVRNFSTDVSIEPIDKLRKIK